MTFVRPARLIDPVCGMTVDVASAAADGRLLEHGGRTYAFCRAECQLAFRADPEAHLAGTGTAAHAEAAHEGAASATPAADAAAMPSSALPVIDEGIRRWYESCSCCLGDAYPEIKAQLDAERAAASQPPVDPGICEVAEAATPR